MARIKISLLSILFMVNYVLSYTLDDIVPLFEAKLNKTIASLENNKYPHYTIKGKWYSEAYNKWTAGFFPGCLWELYSITGKEYWKNQASLYTENVKENQNNNQTHDVGFIIYNSFGRGYQLTKNPEYLDVVLKTSNTLSTRFSNVTKVIKSWQSCDTDDYKVIIDNMMNLELLWWSSQNKKNGTIEPKSDWYQIADSHATTTSKNHFRQDYSTFHVINYNQKRTGLIIYKGTHQGNDYSSTWSRGQAWAIYGYILSYKYSNNEQYFNIFEKSYKLYKHKIQNDLVPNWDLDALDIKYKDTSASAIVSCALLEISVLKNNPTYFKDAKKILLALLKDYVSDANDDKFDAILLHGTSNFPKDLYDQGLIYGDFYFIKAINLYHQYKNKFNL